MTDQILIGTDVESHEPVKVPRRLFGHMHVRGMTGSGKTSLTLIPMIDQFIQPYGDGDKERDPIFVFDLGGDSNLFWNTARAAEKAKGGRATETQYGGG